MSDLRKFQPIVKTMLFYANKWEVRHLVPSIQVYKTVHDSNVFILTQE